MVEAFNKLFNFRVGSCLVNEIENSKNTGFKWPFQQINKVSLEIWYQYNVIGLIKDERKTKVNEARDGIKWSIVTIPTFLLESKRLPKQSRKLWTLKDNAEYIGSPTWP